MLLITDGCWFPLPITALTAFEPAPQKYLDSDRSPKSEALPVVDVVT